MELALVAGGLDGVMPPAAAYSWASDPRSELCIWTVKLDSAARSAFHAALDLSRVLYLFGGTQLRVNGEPIDEGQAVQIVPDADIRVENGSSPASCCCYKPVPLASLAQHICHEYPGRDSTGDAHYHDTGCGWPWTSDDPVHPRSEGRQARYR